MMPFLSVTTWSLHRQLGPLRWTRWDAKAGRHATEIQTQPETLSLLELPAALAERGFKAADVCHFHIPDTGGTYLERLRRAFQEADVRFYTLLADYGDISSPDEARRRADIEWTKGWIDIAAAVGAERVRVVAGEADPADRKALDRSAEALRELADYAAARKVRVATENFKSLTSTADNCLYVADACGGPERIGFISDFGNLNASTKYEALSRIIPISDNIHAKAATDADGIPDRDELIRCMELVKAAGYEGPVTVVYDGPGDMWEGIERVSDVLSPYLS